MLLIGFPQFSSSPAMVHKRYGLHITVARPLAPPPGPCEMAVAGGVEFRGLRPHDNAGI